MPSIRIFVEHSESEWKCIEELAAANGFKNAKNYVHRKFMKAAAKLPISDTIPDKKKVVSFTIDDNDLIIRINCYCRKHKIKPSSLLRRLATNPDIIKCLIGSEVLPD